MNKPKFLAFIVVIIALGVFYFYGNGWQLPGWFNIQSQSINSPQETSNNTITNEEENISSFEECIAAGNKTLPDAPDKCLTKGGHVFIEGVVEGGNE